MNDFNTYDLAHSARIKLEKAATCTDHKLRQIVGHANMLDLIMDDLGGTEMKEGCLEPLDATMREKEHSLGQKSAIEQPEAGLKARNKHIEGASQDKKQIDGQRTEVDSNIDDEFDDTLILRRTPSRHSPAGPVGS